MIQRAGKKKELEWALYWKMKSLDFAEIWD